MPTFRPDRSCDRRSLPIKHKAGRVVALPAARVEALYGTVTLAVPVCPFRLAETFIGPLVVLPVAVAKPLLLITTFVTSAELHVTCDVRFTVELSLNVPIAVNC